MPKQYGPLNPSYPHILHGGDYNPEQWIDSPEIWTEDMRLMKLAGCNAMSVGIFSWAMYEPEEGKYQFEWMDRVMDMLAANGAKAVLATPSGAKPAWMAIKYPETRRIDKQGELEKVGSRHNHCATSPVYREKIVALNTLLAERYKDHPALLVWHVSNEYNGSGCYCDLCFGAFREWLKKRYSSLDQLNRSWWTTFWSHRFNAWDEIVAIDNCVEGMVLDWKRFTTDQMVDFMRTESAPLRKITPHIPITANLMGTYEPLNYWKFAPHLDVISWDSYPAWDSPQGNHKVACGTAMAHDLNRSLKGGKPFMLMESSPSNQNWMQVCRSKRPGMHILSSLQAVAHGADTVQYFQWRKSRGSCEKFHGAVVDHVGNENTRVFREVAELGDILKKLSPVIGTSVEPKVAIVYDWENRWALESSSGPHNLRKNMMERIEMHYREFWRRGISVDLISEDSALTGYQLVIAPMLYQVRQGFAEKMEAFVSAGGTFVTTYLSGVVDDTHLCFLNGFPGPLRKLMGVWSEETDVFYPEQSQNIVSAEGNALGLKGSYAVQDYADVIHLEGSESLATYGEDYYQGSSALTVNAFGKGEAYYVASRNDDEFFKDFYEGLTEKLGLKSVLGTVLPVGVSATVREDEQQRFVFVMNFNASAVSVELGGKEYVNVVSGDGVKGSLALEGNGFAVLKVG